MALDLQILDVPASGKGSVDKIRITSIGHIYFSGKMIANEIDFSQIIFFVIGKMRDPNDHSIYLWPDKQGAEKTQIIKWAENKDNHLKYINVSRIMDSYKLKKGTDVDYTIHDENGQKIIQLHTFKNKQESPQLTPVNKNTLPKKAAAKKVSKPKKPAKKATRKKATRKKA